MKKQIIQTVLMTLLFFLLTFVFFFQAFIPDIKLQILDGLIVGISGYYLLSFWIPKLKLLKEEYYYDKDIKTDIYQIVNPTGYFLALEEYGEEYSEELYDLKEKILTSPANASYDCPGNRYVLSEHLAYIALCDPEERKLLLEEVYENGLPGGDFDWEIENYVDVFETIDLFHDAEPKLASELVGFYINEMINEREFDEDWYKAIVDAIADHEIMEAIGVQILSALVRSWPSLSLIDYVLSTYGGHGEWEMFDEMISYIVGRYLQNKDFKTCKTFMYALPTNSVSYLTVLKRMDAILMIKSYEEN